MKTYLINQIKLTENNKALFFENYALKQALNTLENKGIEVLKNAIKNALNDNLLSSQQRFFFNELNAKF
jgi:hypothetical protein